MRSTEANKMKFRKNWDAQIVLKMKSCIKAIKDISEIFKAVAILEGNC